jgi:SAM-dependent methyltransferase
MESGKDAYGHIIWNSFKGLTSFDVVERDDGYVNVDQNVKLYFAGYKDWKEHEKRAIKLARGRVLDVGCGAGRILLYLQKNGHKVTGIDTSPLAIKVCKLRGAKDARIMAIEEIGKFKPSSFDSVVMLGYNFGLFGSMKKAKYLLRAMYKITSDGAVIIAETRDPYLTDNPVHFQYHKMNKRRGRMPGQLRLRVRFMQYATDWHDYLYVSKPEMKELLSDTGWRAKRFIDAEGHRENGLYIAIIAKTAR